MVCVVVLGLVVYVVMVWVVGLDVGVYLIVVCVVGLGVGVYLMVIRGFGVVMYGTTQFFEPEKCPLMLGQTSVTLSL